MFKKIVITLVILNLTLNANEKDILTENDIDKKVELCEYSYDSCKSICEKLENIHLDNCFTQCDFKFEECVLHDK